MKQIENYGELISAATGYQLLKFEMFGSYQGDFIAILTDGEDIFIYKGSYGSCSGCDWLEAEGNYQQVDGKWGTYLSDEQIKSYLSDDKPFLTIKKNQIDTIINSDNIEQYFPANTRNDYDDWNWSDVKKMIKETTKSNDLPN